MPQNGGRRERVVARDVGAARQRAGRLGLRGLALGRDAPAALVAGLALGPRGLLGGVDGGRAAAPPGHRGVHQPQALERVARVGDPALVDLRQVVLHVGAGERGAAEQHGELRPPRARSSPGGSPS